LKCSQHIRLEREGKEKKLDKGKKRGKKEGSGALDFPPSA